MPDTWILRTAAGAGLVHSPPEAGRPWQRLQCPACGARLDLPSAEGPGWIRYAEWARRRVAGFALQHRPGGKHL